MFFFSRCLRLPELLFWFIRIEAISKRRPQTKRYDNPINIRALIGTKELPEWGPNKLERLEARSLPNEHVRRVFGIETAFTTVDKQYANEFVRRSKDMFNISAHDWHTIGHASESLIQRWEKEAQEGCRNDNVEIKLQPLIQAVTLCAMLKTFF